MQMIENKVMCCHALKRRSFILLHPPRHMVQGDPIPSIGIVVDRHTHHRCAHQMQKPYRCVGTRNVSFSRAPKRQCSTLLLHGVQYPSHTTTIQLPVTPIFTNSSLPRNRSTRHNGADPSLANPLLSHRAPTAHGCRQGERKSTANDAFNPQHRPLLPHGRRWVLLPVPTPPT